MQWLLLSLFGFFVVGLVLGLVGFWVLFGFWLVGWVLFGFLVSLFCCGFFLFYLFICLFLVYLPSDFRLEMVYNP